MIITSPGNHFSHPPPSYFLIQVGLNIKHIPPGSVANTYKKLIGPISRLSKSSQQINLTDIKIAGTPVPPPLITWCS